MPAVEGKVRNVFNFIFQAFSIVAETSMRTVKSDNKTGARTMNENSSFVAVSFALMCSRCNVFYEFIIAMIAR